MNNIDIPVWLLGEFNRLSELVEQQKLPHALLIHGPAGCGRRILGLLLAQRLLGQQPQLCREDLSQDRFDEEVLIHPDFKLLQPPADKRTISVDEVRALSSYLGLTSHQSGAQVAMITPADAMTRGAANGLLKTLEEPTANSYLILVAEHPSRLPATIRSRCQQVRVRLPEAEQALNWLNHQHADESAWQVTLELAGGAPFAALKLNANGLSDLADSLAADIEALKLREITPAAVAKGWSRHDLDACLQWLFIRLSGEIRGHFCEEQRLSGQKAGDKHLQKPLKTINMEPFFAALRQVGELRRSQGSGLNAELHLANVLTHWYGQN